MKPLKVCHIITNTEFGGTQKMLYNLLRELKQSPAGAQLDLSVISLLRCGEIGDSIQQLGVPVHAMEFTEGGIPRPQRMFRLLSKLRSLRPDVVQTWAYHSDLVGGLAARLATSANVVWNIRHGTLDPKVDSKNTLRSAYLCGKLSTWIPKRILLNAHSAVEVHAAAGYDRARLQVIPNGFDVNRFKPLPKARIAIRDELHVPSDAPLIGMCGRLHRHKGQAEFIQAAKQIAATQPQAHFLIAGHLCDSSSSQLTGWVADAGLQDRFHLLGSRNDIPQIMNALDVYVLPSLTEGMPNVIGEAMACGVCVVATDVGDAGRLLGECGTCVPPADPGALANAICELLDQPAAKREAIANAARQRVFDNFEISVIAGVYKSVWSQAAGRKQTLAAPEWLHMPATNQSRSNLPQQLTLKPSMPTSSMPAPTKLVHVTTIPMTQWLFLRGQNQFMVDQGYEVHAVSSPGPFMPKLVGRDPVIPHEIPISRQITPIRDLISTVRLWRLFRQLRPEIVQLSTPKAALLGAIAAKAAFVPVRILQVRGLASESETGIRRTIYQRLEQLTDRLCNGCLVNAKSLLEYAREANILRTGRVAGLGMSNGVDLQRFDPQQVQPADLSAWPDWNRLQQQEQGLVIGYVGRMTRDKGLEDLYQAWQHLRDDFPTAKLLLVGLWESENGVTEKVRAALTQDPRVLIAGVQDDVMPFMQHMDIFAFPSHGTEGFPNAPMEAAAMELPVIATRVIGCVDAVDDGVTGTLIDARNPEQLEAALRVYLEDTALRREHGTAGRTRIRRGFDPAELWAEFHQFYTFLLRREGLPVPETRPQDTKPPQESPRRAA